MPVAIPERAEELEEMLGDEQQLRALFSEKGKFGEFVTAYARNVLNKDQTIAAQVREETQRVVRDFLKSAEGEGYGPDRKANLGPAGLNPMHTQGERDLFAKAGLYNPRAMGAPLDTEFAGPTAHADYFQTIWHNQNKDAETQAKLNRIRNAFSSTVPSEGGFLIPESLRSELLRVSLETSVVRPRARVIPMETLRVPFPAIDASSNVSSVYGGIVGYWTEEGAALTASSASFSRVVLEAKKLTAYTEIPNELISDSIGSFEAFINQIFPEALGFYEDDAFTDGSGVGEPLGYLNADAAIAVAKETAQTANTIVWANIIKMYSRMLPQSLNRAVWVVTPEAFVELATMALEVGTGGSAVWLNNGVGGPPATILGRPVIMTEKVETLGTVGDINFVDFGFYLIGDRQVMSATSSAHYKFGTDMTAYRIISRVDGRPWLNSAMTPKNNGPALSPFVKLATRA